MSLLVLPSTRPHRPIESRALPRWQLRLRAWCLRRLGMQMLRGVRSRPAWAQLRDGARRAAPSLATSARGLLELNLLFERARGKAARSDTKPGSLTAGS